MSSEPQVSPDTPDGTSNTAKHWIVKHWNWCISGAVAILCIALLLTGVVTVRPHYFEEDKHTTAKLIDEFHARWNAGQFERIYDDADESMQRSPGGRDALLEGMRQTRSRFGLFRKVTLSQLNVVPRSPVEVRAVYHDRFDSGETTEFFGFLLRKETFKLAIYEVYPGTMDDTPSNMALKASQEFYRQLAAGQYDAIYAGSADDFKASATRERLLDFLQKTTMVTGRCTSSELRRSIASRTSTGYVFHLWFERTCDTGTVHDGTEWRLNDGRIMLAAYYLSSSDGSRLPLVGGSEYASLSAMTAVSLRGTDQFYRALSAGDYDAIFERSSDDFKDPANRRSIPLIAHMVDESAGACDAPELADTSYMTGTNGLRVVLSYSRKCAKRQITDQFTWKLLNSAALLDGYYVLGLTDWEKVQ